MEIQSHKLLSLYSFECPEKSNANYLDYIERLFFFFFFFYYYFVTATHEKTSLTKKYEKKKKRYVHYSLLIVQMLSCSQYNTYASYKFDTVYYLQHLHYLQYNTYKYLQYDTYTSYNTIFVLLTVKNIFF